MREPMIAVPKEDRTRPCPVAWLILEASTSMAGAEALLEGRTVWTVTPSAAAGSGPAETVAPLVGSSVQ